MDSGGRPGKEDKAMEILMLIMKWAVYAVGFFGFCFVCVLIEDMVFGKWRDREHRKALERWMHDPRKNLRMPSRYDFVWALLIVGLMISPVYAEIDAERQAQADAESQAMAEAMRQDAINAAIQRNEGISIDGQYYGTEEAIQNRANSEVDAYGNYTSFSIENQNVSREHFEAMQAIEDAKSIQDIKDGKWQVGLNLNREDAQVEIDRQVAEREAIIKKREEWRKQHHVEPAKVLQSFEKGYKGGE